jgi:sialidase-1
MKDVNSLLRFLFVFLPLTVLLSSQELCAQKNKTQQTALTLAPGDNNPRNSEGDFITLKDGRILFIYSRYTGKSSDDHAPAYLAGRYSSDGGKNWTTEDQLIVKQEGEMNVMSVSLLRLQNGKIALFYLKKNSERDCIPLMRISADEAKTWSEPIACITDRQGYFVLNNNRVIQLKNGRLLMAVALHGLKDGEWQEAATLYSYFSDDNGVTWKSGGEVPNPQKVVTQEPGVIELKDGRILMFIRTAAGFQYLSYSVDRGETWGQIEPSTIHSPLSPASIARIPWTGDLLMVWNNNNVRDTAWHRGVRTPLTIAVSKDEGQTWEHIKNIETDPDGWYCYMAIHFSKEEVLLGYCAGSQSANTHLSVTKINRLNRKWLYK